MVAPYNPPVKNEDFLIRIALEDMANPGRFKANPTLAAADFNVAIDGAALAALGTTPSVSPAASKLVLITLSAAEMNGDVITLVCSDQTDPPEWADYVVSIPTTSA
jgi:hypothetical protein